MPDSTPPTGDPMFVIPGAEDLSANYRPLRDVAAQLAPHVTEWTSMDLSDTMSGQLQQITWITSNKAIAGVRVLHLPIRVRVHSHYSAVLDSSQIVSAQLTLEPPSLLNRAAIWSTLLLVGAVPDALTAELPVDLPTLRTAPPPGTGCVR